MSARAFTWRGLSTLAALLIAAGCAVQPEQPPKPDESFGVLLMAHGGSKQWNERVLAAVEPLRDRYTIEVAFGMADAAVVRVKNVDFDAEGRQLPPEGPLELSRQRVDLTSEDLAELVCDAFEQRLHGRCTPLLHPRILTVHLQPVIERHQQVTGDDRGRRLPAV